jgi:hypothetical protein
MNTLLTYFFAAVGFLVCAAPVLLIGAFFACHLIAKAKLRRMPVATVDTPPNP